VHDPTAVTAPLRHWRVTPTGDYGDVRSGGVVHNGLDMSTRYEPHDGWNVVAPERMTVRYVDRDPAGSESPLNRYDPGAMLAEGALGFSHLLGHLDPATIPAWIVPGVVVPCGAFVGRVAEGPNHLHWETRTKLLSAPGAERERYTWHPMRWLAMRQLLAVGAVGVAVVKLPFAVVALLAGASAVGASGVTRGGDA
jgi:hypothetical protein